MSAREPVADPAEAPPSRDGGRRRTPRRRPGRFRRWVVRPLFWGLAGLAILIFTLQLVLDTRWARNAARDLIIDKLGSALDRKVGLIDLSFELLPLSVEVWGLTISGPDPDGPLFLDIPWAAVDADLGALQDRRIHLQRVRVQRPVIFVEFFPDGTHNMIKFSRKGPRRFDLYIDRVEIDRAELGIEQRSVQISIAADNMRARFDGRGEMDLFGQVDGHNVVVRLPNARPVTVAFSARGSIRRGLVEFESMRISGPDISAIASGGCEYPEGTQGGRKCFFQASGRTDGVLLDELGYFDQLRGAMDFEGSVAWRPGAFGWRSRVQAAEIEIWGRRLEDVKGSLVADRYGFRIGIDEASYAGGRLSGVITWRTQDEGKPWAADIDFEDLLMDSVLADQAIPSQGYASRLDGNLTYRFLSGHGGRGAGHAEIEATPDPELAGLPLSGAFPLRITDGVVRAESISMQSARQSVLAGGWYDLELKRGVWEYEINSADLVELLPLLPLSDPSEPSPWLPSAGQGELAGTLYIEADSVSSDLRLRLEQVEAPGLGSHRVSRVSGAMHLTADEAQALHLALGDADEALLLRGDIPFEPTDERAAVVTLDAVNWPLDVARPWLDFELPVDGRISGRLDLQVWADASGGRLDGTVAPVTVTLTAPSTSATGTTRPAAPPPSLTVVADSLRTLFDWDRDRIRFERLDLSAPSGVLSATGTMDWTSEELDLSLHSAALVLSQEPLRQFLPRADIRGEIAVKGHLSGRLARPRLELVVEADDLALGQRVLEGRASKLEVLWNDGRVRTSGRLLEMITVNGGGTLDSRGADLALVIEGSDVGGLAELLLEDPPADLDGRFSGTLYIRAAENSPGNAPAPFVELLLDELRISLRDRALENREPVKLLLETEHIVIHSLELGEAATGSELSLTGNLGYAMPTTLDLDLRSTISGDWLKLLDLGFDVDGTLELEGKVAGSFDQPTFEGGGWLRDGRLILPADFPLEIRDLNGALRFRPGSVVLEQLAGTLGGGRVTLDGEATLPRPDQPVVYQLRFTGTDLGLPYLEGWSVRGDTRLTMRSTAGGPSKEGGHILEGQAELTEIGYGEDIPANFEQLMRGFLRRQRLEVTPTDSLLSTVELNLEVTAPNAVRIRNNLADLRGSARFLIRGNLAEPVLLGEVDIVPGGTLLYNSTDYRIERGRVTFANPYEIDPEIDLVAVTRVRDFDVTLAVNGTFTRLETRFSSEPPLPDLEVFRLLASGGDERTDSTAAALHPAEIRQEDQSTSAATFLYGQAASVIGQRVNTLFGFDKFRIDPLTGSGDNLSKARVTVGKRLSKDVFITYSADPSSTEAQRLRIEWRVGSGLTLVFTQNGDDSYSADARWGSSF